MNWLDTILQGILLGGLYALFAAGLSLVFGIMRLVNLAHGDLIVLAAFLILVLVTTLGLNPFVAAADRHAADVRHRLGAAILPAQPHARQGYPAAAARHLRPVDRHPERPARRLFRRQPAHLGRQPGNALGRSRPDQCRRHAAADLRLGHRRHRRPQPADLPHLARPRLSRHLGRSGDRRADGHPAEAHLRHRHRASPWWW